jgi:DNA adenine methylase
MRRVKILPIYGGKGPILDHLLRLTPYLDVYVEPFFGGGSLFFARHPSKVEIINDINDVIVSLYRVIRNPKKLAMLIYKLEFTPYARSELKLARRIAKGRVKSELLKAWAAIVMYNMSFSGTTRGFSRDTTKWVRVQSAILSAHKRLKNAIIENKDGVQLCREVDDRNVVIYMDPPYLPEAISSQGGRDLSQVRSDISGSYMGNLMDVEKHIELLEFAVSAKSAIVISGYMSDLYAKYLNERNGWITHVVPTVATAANTIRPDRVEVIWVNRRAAEVSSMVPLIIRAPAY